MHFDGAPADPAAAQPDQGTQARRELPEVEDVARRERVEIAREQVEPAVVLLDGPEQSVQLDHASPLGPCGMHRAEVHTGYQDARRDGWISRKACRESGRCHVCVVAG